MRKPPTSSGRPVSTLPDSRASAESARTSARISTRARMNSASVRSVSERLPPLVYWMRIASTVQSRSCDAQRSAIAWRESSIGLPTWVSTTTRANSSARGGFPSWATISMACNIEAPESSDPARSWSTVGSWFSRAIRRLRPLRIIQ